MKIAAAAGAPRTLERRGAARRPTVAEVTPVDIATIAGLSEAELTPAVRDAVGALGAEIEALREEVRRLKAWLVEAEEAADRDPLTPVLNRRAFVRELHRVAAHAERYGGGASLIYVDLDDLKGINDRHGHAAGDRVLQAVAEALGDHVRESDVIGRMGGDEFAIALVHADRATAEAKAASLAVLVEAMPIAWNGQSLQARISVGVREIGPGVDAETVIAEADAAMFLRKRARRAERA